jgi:hypothetical protein
MPGPRLGGGAGASTSPSSPAVTTRPCATRSPGRTLTRSCWPATCGSSARRCWPRSAVGS